MLLPVSCRQSPVDWQSLPVCGTKPHPRRPMLPPHKCVCAARWAGCSMGFRDREDHMSNTIREGLQRRRSELQARAERIASDLRGEATPTEGGFVDHATAHANDNVLQEIR